jgi:hypothetical protein
MHKNGSEFQSRKDPAPGILETRVLNFLSPDICHHSLKLSRHNERGFSDREVKSSTTESFGALEVGISGVGRIHQDYFFPLSSHLCIHVCFTQGFCLCIHLKLQIFFRSCDKKLSKRLAVIILGLEESFS